MKKSIALLLCLVLVLSLCACGAKESVVGTWNASVNMADLFNEQMASEPEMAEYVKLETLNFAFVLELKEDGTCTMKVDPDAMTAAIEEIPYALLHKITDRITHEVEGINRVLYDLTPKPIGTIEWE